MRGRRLQSPAGHGDAGERTDSKELAQLKVPDFVARYTGISRCTGLCARRFPASPGVSRHPSAEGLSLGVFLFQWANISGKGTLGDDDAQVPRGDRAVEVGQAELIKESWGGRSADQQAHPFRRTKSSKNELAPIPQPNPLGPLRHSQLDATFNDSLRELVASFSFTG